VRETLRSLFSRLRVHPSLLYTLQILCWIKLRKQESDAETICKMIEVVLRWRRKTLGDWHDLTLVSEYDLAMAKRECGNLGEAKHGFQTVFQQRRARLGNPHPETNSAKREFMITCSALGHRKDPDSLPPPPIRLEALSREISKTSTEPSYSANTVVEDADPRSSPMAPHETEQMSPDDWSKVEAQSKAIAAEQESRLGTSHPETINALLWLFAVQFLIGIVSVGAQTMITLLFRLRQAAIREQRLLNALQMEEKIAWICTEQNLTGYALDINHAIRRHIEEMPPDGEEMYEELLALKVRCDERIAQADDPVEAERLVDTILQIGAETKYHSDGDVYLINALRLAFLAGLKRDSSIVGVLKSRVTARLRALMEEARTRPAGVSGEKAVEQALAVLEAGSPGHIMGLADFQVKVSRMLVSGYDFREDVGIPREQMDKLGEGRTRASAEANSSATSGENVEKALRLCLDFLLNAGHAIDPR